MWHPQHLGPCPVVLIALSSPLIECRIWNILSKETKQDWMGVCFRNDTYFAGESYEEECSKKQLYFIPHCEGLFLSSTGTNWLKKKSNKKITARPNLNKKFHYTIHSWEMRWSGLLLKYFVGTSPKIITRFLSLEHSNNTHKRPYT